MQCKTGPLTQDVKGRSYSSAYIMKKTNIILLSVCIIAAMLITTVGSAISMIGAFTTGFSEGIKVEKERDFVTPVALDFEVPYDHYFNTKDSIAFNNGEEFPIVISKSVVMMPTSKIPIWTNVVTGICELASIVAICFFIYYFVRFVINVSRDKIFVIENARYLRRIGYWLIADALIAIISGCCLEYEISRLNLGLKEYAVAADWSLPWSTLIIAFVSLLIATVWSHGIAIREEQELTI